MKKLAALIIALFVCSCSFAQGVPAPATPRLQVNDAGDLNGPLKPLYTTPVAADGSTATVEIALPAIALATRSTALLGTGTVTLLSSVASFTDGDFILFQARGKFYWSVLSGTSASAADMQLGAFVGESGDTPVFLRLKTTADLAFVADSAATATLTYTLGREQ